MNTLLFYLNDAETKDLFFYLLLACAILLIIIMFILIVISGKIKRQNETIIKLLKEKNNENLKP